MSRSFNIGNRNIGETEPCFIIAEVAQAHEGTLSFAHSFIDSAATAGADAIKFQMHMANAESTKDEQFRISMGNQDITRYDYWQRTSFDAVQWKELAEHADESGLVFLCSFPFDRLFFIIIIDIERHLRLEKRLPIQFFFFHLFQYQFVHIMEKPIAEKYHSSINSPY